MARRPSKEEKRLRAAIEIVRGASAEEVPGRAFAVVLVDSLPRLLGPAPSLDAALRLLAAEYRDAVEAEDARPELPESVTAALEAIRDPELRIVADILCGVGVGLVDVMLDQDFESPPVEFEGLAINGPSDYEVVVAAEAAPPNQSFEMYVIAFAAATMTRPGRDALTAALAAEPSEVAWQRVCKALDGARHGPELDEMVAEADRRLAAWPEELRRAPEHWLDEHPCPPLRIARRAYAHVQRFRHLVKPDASALRHVLYPAATVDVADLRRVIAALPELRSLGLRRFRREPVEAIVAALATATRLEHLDLQSAFIGWHSTFALAMASSAAFEQLRVLALDSNDLTAVDAGALATAPWAHRLRRLALSQNYFRNEGAAALAAGGLAGLEYLELNNVGIDDDGARALADSKTLPATATIVVTTNFLTDEGIRLLRRRFKTCKYSGQQRR